MRVISQNGTMDFPYDNSLVFLYKNSIKGNTCVEIQLYGGTEIDAAAEYSTEEKAIKAMEMLREAWINGTVEFTHGIYHRNIVFRFPQDDEIEV